MNTYDRRQAFFPLFPGLLFSISFRSFPWFILLRYSSDVFFLVFFGCFFRRGAGFITRRRFGFSTGMLITVAVMIVNVFQIAENRSGTTILGMIARDNSGHFFVADTFCRVLMIKKEPLIVSTGDYPPAVMSGDNVNNVIQKHEGKIVISAETLYLITFLSVFLRDGRAASAQSVSVCLCLFKTFKTAAAFFWNTPEDLAMRKMNDLSM